MIWQNIGEMRLGGLCVQRSRVFTTYKFCRPTTFQARTNVTIKSPLITNNLSPINMFNIKNSIFFSFYSKNHPRNNGKQGEFTFTTVRTIFTDFIAAYGEGNQLFNFYVALF